MLKSEFKECISKIVSRQTIIYTSLSLMASACNFFSAIMLGRSFGVSDYGVIVTLIALNTNLRVFMGPVSTLIIRYAAMEDEEGRKGLSDAGVLAIIINLTTIVLMLIGINPLMKYASISSWFEYLFFIVSILLSSIGCIGHDLVQARQNLILLGICDVMLIVVRTVIAIGCGMIGKGPISIIYGIALGYVSVLVLAYKYIKQKLCEMSGAWIFKVHRESIEYYIWALLLSLISTAYLNGGDILLGKIYSENESIGYYSVASNISRIAMYLIVTPLGTILFTKLVSKQNKEDNQKKLLLTAEFVSVCGIIVYGGVTLLASNIIISVLYGSAFLDAKKYLLTNLIMVMGVGIYYLCLQYILAIGKIKDFTIICAFWALVAFLYIMFSRCKLNSIPIVFFIAIIMSIICLLLRESRARRSEK